MHGVHWTAVSAEIATGTSAKTLVQVVAAANIREIIKWIRVSFKGVSTTDAPILVRVLRQSTAGTMSSLTVNKINSGDDETLQVTAQHTASAEPTAGNVLCSALVHPQGNYTFWFPDNAPLILKGGERIGVEVTAGVGVNAVVEVRGEE